LGQAGLEQRWVLGSNFLWAVASAVGWVDRLGVYRRPARQFRVWRVNWLKLAYRRPERRAGCVADLLLGTAWRF
jgi:hypothetical protein